MNLPCDIPDVSIYWNKAYLQLLAREHLENLKVRIPQKFVTMMTDQFIKLLIKSKASMVRRKKDR